LSVQNSGRGYRIFSPARLPSARALRAAPGSRRRRPRRPASTSSLRRCARALRDQRFDYGLLELARNVGARLIVQLHVARRDDDRGLQSAEAEIETRAIEHRPRELEFAGSAAAGERCQRRSARIRQAEQLRGLVERSPAASSSDEPMIS
jgi:hypothetical protein